MVRIRFPPAESHANRSSWYSLAIQDCGRCLERQGSTPGRASRHTRQPARGLRSGCAAFIDRWRRVAGTRRPMARGQQPRPGEQLLAQGAGEVVTFVDARSCRIGTTRSTKFSSPSGVTMRLRLKPSISVSSTHEIRSSAISSAEPTTAGLRLPSPIRLTIHRNVQGSVLNVVSISTAELIASFFT